MPDKQRPANVLPIQPSREILRARSKTFSFRWRRFWLDARDGRKYWQRATHRVWGLDAQGERHYLGMGAANTPEAVLAEQFAIGAYRNPDVLGWKITTESVSEDKTIGERAGNCVGRFLFWFKKSALLALRMTIFVLLLYAIDHTPLDAPRLIGYFHLGSVAAWFLAAAAIYVLWRLSQLIMFGVGFCIGLVSALTRRA